MKRCARFWVDLGGAGTLRRTIIEKVSVLSIGSDEALSRQVPIIELKRERLNQFVRDDGTKSTSAEIHTERYAPDLGVAVQRTTETSPQAVAGPGPRSP